MATGSPLLRLDGVSKRFHATQALECVSLELCPGEVHSLVGENGAGKSTLIKVVGGVYAPDAGQILLEGAEKRFLGPRDAQASGIVVIPQEMQLVPAATVAENVTLGDWPTRRAWGVLPTVDRRRMRERADEALRRLRFRRGLDEPVRDLSFAERQLVAVARALCRSARVLILDEPTASLEQRESERLFEILAGLKAEGVGILFVSHRLDEVMRLSDRCTVLRDGRVVDVSRRGEIQKDRLMRLMAGRDLEELHRPHTRRLGEPLLETRPGEARAGGRQGEEDALPDGASGVHLRRGEIVGLAGLLGAGTSTCLREIFGAGAEAGALTLRGAATLLRSPSDAIRAGVALIAGDRRQGLVPGFSIRDNIVLPHLDRFQRRCCLDPLAMDRLVADLIETLDIRPADPGRPVRELSGGNQQKVLFARWLVGKVDVLLLDEPTQGIDVGAKARVHRLMRQFVEEGGGILFASSETEEVIAMSDSVLAMARGRIIGRLSRAENRYSEGSLRAILGG
ncbi:MAG: sugar ABC transporter ATP-binding protein [Deltaproteobacteria bacterium]|nr:sugar ABC transporter ATP-binding protein [Deltaproteobacteria bacterium]